MKALMEFVFRNLAAAILWRARYPEDPAYLVNSLMNLSDGIVDLRKRMTVLEELPGRRSGELDRIREICDSLSCEVTHAEQDRKQLSKRLLKLGEVKSLPLCKCNSTPLLPAFGVQYGRLLFVYQSKNQEPFLVGMDHTTMGGPIKAMEEALEVASASAMRNGLDIHESNICALGSREFVCEFRAEVHKRASK